MSSDDWKREEERKGVDRIGPDGNGPERKGLDGSGSGRPDSFGCLDSYQSLYAECIANGCTHTLADMLASRSFPGSKGLDRNFMQGRKLGGAQFEAIPLVGDHHLARARAAGVSTTGKWYSGTLARYPGDPEAWVDSTGDVKSLCERRGWGCDGAVKVESPRYAGSEPGPYRVADDLVDRYVDDAIDADPDLAPRRAEVQEEMAHKLSGIHGR